MKLKKKDLLEIIDSNGELIGKNDVPQTGSDLESQANGTTDMNVGKSTQPFRYDMLGRFGFSMFPFMEGKENQGQVELLTDLKKLMHERYLDILGHYYRNPNQLKPDYRKEDEGQESEESKKFDAEWALKIVKVVEKHFENAFKEPEALDEAAVVEDKVVEKKNEDEISEKGDDKEMQEKKLEKIAGLISKLDKEAKDKLKNLLERNG